MVGVWAKHIAMVGAAVVAALFLGLATIVVLGERAAAILGWCGGAVMVVWTLGAFAGVWGPDAAGDDDAG